MGSVKRSVSIIELNLSNPGSGLHVRVKDCTFRGETVNGKFGAHICDRGDLGRVTETAAGYLRLCIEGEASDEEYYNIHDRAEKVLRAVLRDADNAYRAERELASPPYLVNRDGEA